MLQKGSFIREYDVGGCFGEIPNLTGEIRLFTVISVGPSECYVLSKDDFACFDSHLCNQIKNFSSLNDVNISLQDLFYVKTLGNGRFGKVYLVHNQKHFYAIKYASIDTICRSKNLVKYYLNEKKIKPDNCMIDKTGYLKLIDFGIAKDLKNKELTNTICGTPHYLAPEVIMGKGYSFSSDYWSIGVTMFEIFYGYVSFGQSSKDVMGVYYEILNKKLVLPYEPKFNDINSFFKIILSKNLMQRVCNFSIATFTSFFSSI